MSSGRLQVRAGFWGDAHITDEANMDANPECKASEWGLKMECEDTLQMSEARSITAAIAGNDCSAFGALVRVQSLGRELVREVSSR